MDEGKVSSLTEHSSANMKKVLIVFGTRPVAVDTSTVRLAGTDKQEITNETQRLPDCQEAFKETARAHDLCGDGLAGIE